MTLVLGPPNSGKMGYALEWWRARLPFQPVVVAPTGHDAQELTAEMARRAGALVGQSPALTFEGLARAILGRPLRHISEFEHAMLMSQLLRRTPLRSLDQVASLPGAAASLAALLRQMAESGRTVDELSGIMDRWGRLEPRAADLAADIRRLSVAYAQAREQWGLADGPAVIGDAAREAAREAGREAGDWVRPVALYGFTSFTSGQRVLIQALSRRTQILVTLSHGRSRAVSLVAPSEVSWWQSVATRTLELVPQVGAYSSPAIAYLERYFLADPPLPKPPAAVSGPQGVRFLVSSGRRNEAELAAKHIGILIKEGFSPSRIAVIVRQVEEWGRLLGEVFASCGIPCLIDERRMLAQTGLGKAFLNVVTALAHDDAEAFLAFLRSPYSGLALEAAAEMELCYRRGAPRGARALREAGTRLHPEVFEHLGRVVAQGEAGSCLDVVAAGELARHLAVSGLRGTTVGSREAEEDGRAFRALSAALLSLSRLASGPDAAEWLDVPTVLPPLAKTLIPSARPETGEAVQVLSVQRARARRFDAVVVLGLVEGEFPRLPERPSLLTGAQKARIDSLAGGGLFPPETEHEAALFMSAVSRAWQVLFLSTRDADDGGGEAVPSYLWDLSKGLLGVGDSEVEKRTLADLVFDPGSAPSERHYLRGCAASGCEPHPAVWSGSGGIWSRPRRSHPARLVDPVVLAELAAVESFTPSALESYLACAFAWFVERVIGIADIEPELDGRALGQLLHTALSATYGRLGVAGLLPLRAEGQPEAERIVSSIIDGLVQGQNCPGTAAAKRIAAWRLKRLAHNLFQLECGDQCLLTASETELSVGGSSGVDIGGLKIRGRIDRIDSAPPHPALFVLDYKSGAAPAASSIGRESGLQLPLYLLALAADRPDASVIGGAYLSLSEGRRTGVVLAGSEGPLGGEIAGCRMLDARQMEELFRQTRELALEAAAGIRAGNIAPVADRECASWCRLGTVCRSRRAGYRP